MKPQINFYFFSFPTFFLVLGITGLLIAYILHLKLLKYEKNSNFTFSREIAFELFSLSMFTGFLGGRFFHVFFEEWNFYAYFPQEIFRFWNGGFVYYGGFLLALISAQIYLYVKKQNFLQWLNFFTPLISLSYAFGRIGCFFEGCCFGAYCEWPWAIQQRHPTQIYMVIAELLLFFVINKMNELHKYKDSIFFIWLSLHAATRFVIEFFRNDERGEFYFGLSIAQNMSLIFFIFAVFKLLIKKATQSNSTTHTTLS